MAQVSQHHKKTRMIAVAALIVGILGLGVAFAAISTTLNINGTAKISSASWDIHWEDLSCTKTGEATIGSPVPAISSDTLTITADPTFTAPQDTVTCNFAAVNAGNLDATLTSASFAANITDLANVGADGGIGYTLKYRTTAGGATVGDTVGAANLDLAHGQKHEMQLIFTNNNTILQGAPSQGSFSFTIPYFQKNQ
jgi:hypothetical protein